MSNKNISVPRSNCCNSPVIISSDVDEIDKIGCTCYHVCTKCNNPCDVHLNQRKSWEINPKTRVVPNKKKERFCSKKELQEILKNEDF